MALYSINNERDLVLFSAVASEVTAATFAATASAGEGQVFTEQGIVPTAESKFYFLYKHLDGRLRRSDVIDPQKLIKLKQVANVSEVLPKVTVTVASAVVGDLYEVIVKIMNDGSLGTEDIVFLTGSFIGADTNTTNIAAGLVASLNAAQTRMGQTYFTITNSSAVITLQSIKLPFVTGKKDGRPIDFICKATQVAPSTDATTGLALSYTAYTPNPTSVNFLKDLEWQTRGAFADSLRGLAYPNDFAFESDVVAGTDYELFEIDFYDGDQYNHAVQKSPRHLTVAVADAIKATVAAAVATAIGPTYPIATATALGMVSVGTGISVATDGEITVP
jgi:hypothetical protein